MRHAAHKVPEHVPEISMPALSLTQPWATLVICGAKRLESRSWGTAYRGNLAIHAARRMPDEARHACYEQPFLDALVRAGITRLDLLPRGLVLGTVTLADCRQQAYNEPMPDEPEASFGDFSTGRWIWTLDSPIPLSQPEPARGKLGLWIWYWDGEAG